MKWKMREIWKIIHFKNRRWLACLQIHFPYCCHLIQANTGKLYLERHCKIYKLRWITKYIPLMSFPTQKKNSAFCQQISVQCRSPKRNLHHGAHEALHVVSNCIIRTSGHTQIMVILINFSASHFWSWVQFLFSECELQYNYLLITYISPPQISEIVVDNTT